MERRHRPRPESETEREPVAREDAPPAPALDPAAASPAAILAMQRGSGNQAVARAILARNGPHPAPAAGVTPPSAAPPAVPPKTEKERIEKLEADYANAVAKRDFGRAATLLNGYSDDDIKAKLKTYTAADLRLLDDGAQRSMVGFDGRLRGFIVAALKGLGVSDARAATGRQYGEIRASVGAITQGDKANNKRYTYPIDIYFKPDTSAVNADEIAFIQRVRLVETATGANKDWDATNQKRQTDRKSSIDRLSGKKQGWYGMNDDQSDGGNLTVWKKGGSAAEAHMYDGPGARLGDVTWEFETAAVCKKGADAGTVYATITWGFTVDSEWKVTAFPIKIFNKPTADLGAAVGKWNEQAKGPAADRNAPDQAELPALK